MRALFQHGLFIVALALPVSATAQEPAVTVGENGTVEARMTLDASESSIRDVLDDIAGELAALSPDVLSVAVVNDGKCQEVSRRTRGLLRPFRLKSLRCPTASGWHESLIESRDFSAYSTDWSVIETSDGTEVIYTIETDLYIFPRPLVTRTVVQSAKGQLMELARKVVRK